LYYWELDDIGGKPKGVWNLKKVGEVRKVDSKNLYGLPDGRKFPNQFVFEILVKGSTMCVMCADSLQQTQDWMSILTKAINPEMYPPETRKWKIMHDATTRKRNSSAAYSGRLSIDSTDDDLTDARRRKGSSSSKIDETGTKKMPKGPYGLTLYSVLASKGDMPDLAETNKNSTNSQLTSGLLFSIDFGVEREMIKKIKELKEKNAKVQSALKKRLEEFEKDQEKKKKKAEERRKKQEEEEEEETKTTSSSSSSSSKTMDPIANAALAAAKSKKIRNLMSLVGISEIQCQRLLESHDWDLERAANSYFHSSGGSPIGSRLPPPPNTVTTNPLPVPSSTITSTTTTVHSSPRRAQTVVTSKNVQMPSNMRWQYQDHNGQFRNYLVDDARELEAAFVMKKDTCMLNNRFGNYLVTFLPTGCTQMNMKTRKIRNVRRFVMAPQLTPQQQQKVHQLMSFVGGGEAQCRNMLVKSNWDVQTAINGFFDESRGGGGGGGGGGVNRAMFM